jgi:haloalkane dehalogenase
MGIARISDVSRVSRRTFLHTSATIAGLTGAALAAGDVAGVLAQTPANGTPPARDLTAAEFQKLRRFVETPYGRIAYVEQGRGPAALFMHGLPLNGFQWRGAIPRLSSLRRCIAPDFLGLGYTEARDDRGFAPTVQAEMIAALLDKLNIDSIDLIASDSGGAVAQLFAARNPARVRTLLLTNCDVHTNSPPQLMMPAVELARKGELADLLAKQIADKPFTRSPEGIGGVCYTYPSNPTDEAIDYYFAPLVSSPARKAQLHAYTLSFEPNQLPGIEPMLKKLPAPTRMVWGSADKFFEMSWAEWLDRTVPHSRGIRRVEGAKLFFPEEMPDVIAEEAIKLWQAK